MEICRRVLNTHLTDLGVDNSRKLNVLVAGLNHLNDKLAGVGVEFRDEPRPVPAMFGGPALVKEEPNEMNLSAALYGAPSYPSPEVAESSEPPNMMDQTPEIHPPPIHAQTTSQSLTEHRQTDSQTDSEANSETGSETDSQTTPEEETLSVTASRVTEPGNKAPVVTSTYKVLMHGIRVGSMDMTPQGK
ncbi:hypothetical protein H2201_003206 [Coniosporium apollinis]|uniref:Uncharacterized protein n=1 Tax=Coniosporium apollinis TaxID=61459 RepID=A0ABQ9NVX8_9PEZI|nr:hypothetical protein H2201_003206 [Coniosporium apollinis]